MTRAAASWGWRSSTSRPTASASVKSPLRVRTSSCEVAAGAEALADGVSQRAHVVAGRAHQPQAQHRAAPFERLDRGGCHLHRLQLDRRVAAGEIVRAIAVDFLGRKNRGLLQIGAAKLRDRFLNQCGRSALPPGAGAHARRYRRRDRASWSSRPARCPLRTLFLRTTETARGGWLCR